ncbi:uncharacterized protein LY79DRAFT_651811 [Colletotrichum navitas]|uniref:Uncharacterized protein n=1 Tax=Colletotrichum navitas TaxID=681940 RepID=A0AAD8V1M6_9PEZI|nr:uncharacterized protein LY79DRAFT_651811 [Colletotrichum navitas]KAK1579922.1 hypothetical protein LY79DRAFT_651811 [Colletotrichum navitas]
MSGVSSTASADVEAGFESVDRNVIGVGQLVGELISGPVRLGLAVVVAIAVVVAVVVFLVVLFVVVVVVVVVVADTIARLSHFRVAVSASVCLGLCVSYPVDILRGVSLSSWLSLEYNAGE